jgi:hypothetical protein
MNMKALITASLMLGLAAAQAKEHQDPTAWERYEQARDIADRHRRELREQEMLRLQRKQESLQRKEYYERKRERDRK